MGRQLVQLADAQLEIPVGPPGMVTVCTVVSSATADPRPPLWRLVPAERPSSEPDESALGRSLH